MTVRQVRHHGGNIIGVFPSLKVGRGMPYESTIERDLLFFLEFSPTVQTYAMQPLTIQGVDADGKPRSYTPDVLVTSTTGKTLIECKPAALSSHPHTRQQVTLGEAWAAENQCAFLLVTDVELRTGPKLANLRLLWRYARWPVAQKPIALCRDLLLKHPAGLPFAELAAHIAPHVPSGSAPAHIYALLFRSVLSADLSLPLTPASVAGWATPT